MSHSPARVVATRVLWRVAKEGAFAAPTLDVEIRRAGLDARDAALATEITYGSLRILPELDAAIAAQQARAARLEPLAQAALRAAVYQILHLSRVPVHAAVDDAVAIVRRERGPRLAGFVNAMLRKLASRRPEQPEPSRATRLPAWLAKELEASLGAERAGRFVEVPEVPPLGLWVQTARIERQALVERLRPSLPQAHIELSPIAPAALRVRGGGDPRQWPGYGEGLFSVQEEGAQLVAQLAGAQPGEQVVDACAGHGGKTLWLAAQVGSAGRVVAVDLHEEKLACIPQEAQRLGLDATPMETRPVDLSVGVGRVRGPFDRVVVDAPCTGLGTLHRRPELLLRVTADDVGRLAELQRQILSRCVGLVRPGGTLIFAVCSPLRAEGLEVALAVEAEHPRLRRLMGDECSLPGDPEGIAPDADGVVRIGPWLLPAEAGGPDLYQVVRWLAA